MRSVILLLILAIPAYAADDPLRPQPIDYGISFAAQPQESIPPTPVIGYSLPTDSRAELWVTDVRGARVRTLYSGQRSAGERVAAGAHTVELRVGERTFRQRVVLLK